MCVCSVCKHVEWCCMVRLSLFVFVLVCGWCLMCVSFVRGVWCDVVGVCCCAIVLCLFVCVCALLCVCFCVLRKCVCALCV